MRGPHHADMVIADCATVPLCHRGGARCPVISAAANLGLQ
jgi:hypothetical protein